MHIAAIAVNPINPPINPEFRIALGRVNTPIPMFPFKMWMMVSKFLEKRNNFDHKNIKSITLTNFELIPD